MQLPADAGRLTLEPIGFVRTGFASKVEAPRQPGATRGVAGRIELLPGRNLEHALLDLEGWDYLWVVFWFHLNSSWRPKVLPPRGPRRRRGVLATRSPHRPNPLGLSAVRLQRVEGLVLHVLDLDMVDGTPVLDIKPYVAYTDAHPGAAAGWLDEAAAAGGEAARDPIACFQVTFSPLACEQAAWVEARTGLPLRGRMEAILAADPSPRPYRRIRREGDSLRLAVQAWRARFTVSGRQVTVLEVASGYRSGQLDAADAADRDALGAHREFVQRWPSGQPAAALRD